MPFLLCRSWSPFCPPTLHNYQKLYLESQPLCHHSVQLLRCTFQISQSLQRKSYTEIWSHPTELSFSKIRLSQVLTICLAHFPKSLNRFFKKYFPVFPVVLSWECRLRKRYSTTDMNRNLPSSFVIGKDVPSSFYRFPGTLFPRYPSFLLVRIII